MNYFTVICIPFILYSTQYIYKRASKSHLVCSINHCIAFSQWKSLISLSFEKIFQAVGRMEANNDQPDDQFMHNILDPLLIFR